MQRVVPQRESSQWRGAPAIRKRKPISLTQCTASRDHSPSGRANHTAALRWKRQPDDRPVHAEEHPLASVADDRLVLVDHVGNEQVGQRAAPAGQHQQAYRSPAAKLLENITTSRPGMKGQRRVDRARREPRCVIFALPPSRIDGMNGTPSSSDCCVAANTGHPEAGARTWRRRAASPEDVEEELLGEVASGNQRKLLFVRLA